MMELAPDRPPEVTIIIPVLNKLEFTRQCLDRIWRNTGTGIAYDVIIVDNGSSDGTEEWFTGAPMFPRPLRYHRNSGNLGFAKGNNLGASLTRSEYLLFLNNDTLVQPGWLSEMLRAIRSGPAVGVVGIKQLFPYTNVIYHTGVVFAPGGVPQHLYPHVDASLPHVNKQRRYQAVTGSCFLIGRALFEECGRFDENYFNGYEDTDLCMAVGQRGREIVCCTGAYIYHYGQITEGRTADDDANAALFSRKWSNLIHVDRDEYVLADGLQRQRERRPPDSPVRSLAEDCIYLADELGQASAFTWVNVELAQSLAELGAPVFVNADRISPTVPAATRRQLARMAVHETPIGGVHIKWSHYWPRHLNLELAGDVNLEFFAINYQFGLPGSEPWDYWLQCLRQNHREKLPVSEFCKSVLQQVGIPEAECHVLHHGYSREVHSVEPPARRGSHFRFLTVTNSHDVGRYGTLSLLDAYSQAFASEDNVTLVIKDYGGGSGDTTLRERLRQLTRGASIEYIANFTDKRELIRLYKSCDAFVSAHRGEGFGMKILDAMACGLPVITPLFGGPTAYCTSENCFPVEFTLTPVTDCVDSRSLAITNQPVWAEPGTASLVQQMRRVYENPERAGTVGGGARAAVLDRFSWEQIARRLIKVTADARGRHRGAPRAKVTTPAPASERSPYWLGLRVSVIVPTHNRKEKLLACLDALARQSVLPQELEVLVVDDGSTDGTGEAVAAASFPFTLRYHRQEGGGPGAARNLGVDQAAGELVLFIGDDVLADERLLEEHLLAHAVNPDPELAILGRIDWPDSVTPNAVMEYVCGDAMLQFAYTLIPKLAVLDHRFFYTSNISLKRRFLLDAADAGVRFDPCFRHAAFEDSEFAFRLMPRGLRIRYAERARAFHDHWMDLDSFAGRELHAGEMAVVYYRKHPGQDEQLQVRWVAELTAPAAGLLKQPELLQHLQAFDRQTDALLRSNAASLEELLAIGSRLELDPAPALSTDRLRAALHNVLRVIFDVERTRGKVREWFSTVDDPAKVRAAQSLGSVLRKIEFLTLDAGPGLPAGLPATMASIDGQVVASLRRKIAELEGTAASSPGRFRPARLRANRAARRLLASSGVLGRLLAADRFVQARLQTAWLERYQRFRSLIRKALS